MDIAAVLNKIRPGAAWRMSDSYENLAATWEDTIQTLPTWEEIEAAWVEMQAEASAPVTPPVDQGTADMWEAILTLSAKLDALEGK